MKKLPALIVIVCGLCLGFFGIPSLTGNAAWKDLTSGVKSGNSEAVMGQLTEIAEWSVMDFKYSNVEKITDSKEIKNLKDGLKIPFTSKTIVMTYDGDIKIGVDADKITVDVEKSGLKVKAVKVGLPPMKITANDIDRDTIKYPLEKNNILNGIKNEDHVKLEEKGKETMAAEVEKNGTMEKAREKLKGDISAYLTALYGQDVEVKFVDL